jgi:hypothetical protein
VTSRLGTGKSLTFIYSVDSQGQEQSGIRNVCLRCIDPHIRSQKFQLKEKEAAVENILFLTLFKMFKALFYISITI